MSLSDFPLFLPGSTNNINSSGSKLSLGSKNQVKIDIKKIQSDFKQLIDTIISLINDKKKLESELVQLKTNTQKQKNIESTTKNSKDLLKYIGLLDNYLIEVNKTLKDYPNEKAEILSTIQNRINQNFGQKPKANNTFEPSTPKANNTFEPSTPKANNTFEPTMKVNNTFGIFTPKNTNTKELVNLSSFLKNNKPNNKYAKTLEELMGVNFEPNNTGNIGNNRKIVEEELVINNKKNNTETIQQNLFLNNIKQNKEEFINNSSNKVENIFKNQIANNSSNKVDNIFKNQTANNSARNMAANNSRNMAANNSASNMAANNSARNMVVNNSRNMAANNSARNMVVNNSARNMAANNSARNMAANNSARNMAANNSSNMAANNSARNMAANNRVIEYEENNEEENEVNKQVTNNKNKSIFETIGETLGLTTSTTPQNNSNTIKTNIKKSKCEGEDCDIFSENVETSEINTKLGNGFNNIENRFNNARIKIKKLMGEQVVLKKNNKGNLENIPREGDIYVYEKT